jgi:DNA-binding transcriptional regulator YiaG
MPNLVSHDVKWIREMLGNAIGRKISQRDLADYLNLGTDGARIIRRWEHGSKEPGGPTTIALKLLFELVVIREEHHWLQVGQSDFMALRQRIEAELETT